MDLTASTPDLQRRNVELLQKIEAVRNGGQDVGTTEARLIEEKHALQAELTRRGDPIRADVRISTAQSAARTQIMTTSNVDDLLAENLALKAKLEAAGVK